MCIAFESPATNLILNQKHHFTIAQYNWKCLFLFTGGGVNILCDVTNATVTSEPEHFCAYHPPNPGTGTVSSVSHLDLRRSGVNVIKLFSSSLTKGQCKLERLTQAGLSF